MRELAWLDANVILRYLLRDREDLFRRAAALFARAEAGTLTLLISPLTLAEAVWVLDSFYGYPRQTICAALGDFLASPGVEPEEREVLLAALEDYRDRNVDFIDAYLFRHAVAKGVARICSFDEKHLRRLGTELEPL